MDGKDGLTGIPPALIEAGRSGPTGVAPAYVVTTAPQGAATAPQGAATAGATGAIDPSCFWVKDGEWYAFRLEGRDFFARVRHDLTTGYLELTEIDDPYKESA